MSKTKFLPNKDYVRFVVEVKERILSARTSAAQAVNRELTSLYWDIGKMILEKQNELGWGKSVVESLSRDLRSAFPASSGFSPRNLWDMRRFYGEYSDPEILRQLVAELTGSRMSGWDQKRIEEMMIDLFASSAISVVIFFCVLNVPKMRAYSVEPFMEGSQYEEA